MDTKMMQIKDLHHSPALSSREKNESSQKIEQIKEKAILFFIRSWKQPTHEYTLDYSRYTAVSVNTCLSENSVKPQS